MPFRYLFAVYLNKFPRYSFVCNLMGNMQKSWIIKKVQTKKFLNFPKYKFGLQFIIKALLTFPIKFWNKVGNTTKISKTFTINMTELSFLDL